MLKSEILKNLNAEELYNSGKTLEEISKLADCDISTVRDYLAKIGVAIRSTGVVRKNFPAKTIVGNWEVISEEPIKENGDFLQLCKCKVCGYETYININKVVGRPSKRCVKCKSSKILLDNGEVDYNYIIKDYFYKQHILKNLSRRNKVGSLEFDITPEYLLELFEKQNRKCAISGVSLDIKALKTGDLVLSLDRIDSNLGYIEGNVQWVHKDINMMKQSYSNDYFVEMCCKIAENNGYSKCS